MAMLTGGDTTELREKIYGFIRNRLESKLEKEREELERARLQKEHEPERWLADAAKRVNPLRLASHILKPIHPDARGTNIRATPVPIADAGLVGTGSIGGLRIDDVVGNTAALDVYKLLSIEHDGHPLWKLADDRDERMLAALSDDRERARSWCEAFAGISGVDSEPTSDTLAKQVYFPMSDGGYHLLAPLFPASLVHAAYRLMQEDRFGESARAAREACKKGERFTHGFREYPELAIRKLGGTNPQNISQLNSERHGENWLLASLPPVWTDSSVRPPWGEESAFPAFGRQRRVRDLTGKLRTFLENTAHNNLTTRRHRAELVADICDEALQYAARLTELVPGWSADPRCRLHEAECLWLDPERKAIDEEFARRAVGSQWAAGVSHRFGNWLNNALSSKTLKLGAEEHAQWKADLMEKLQQLRFEVGESHA